MTFKEWLINEMSDGGEDFFYGLQLYSTDAFDFEPSSRHPAEHSLLQSRWKTEKKMGRKMINIDYDEFQRRSYKAIQSRSLPEAEGDFWRHKPDDGKGDAEVVELPRLTNISWGKTSKDAGTLTKANPPVVVDVDRIFGDKGSNCVQQLSKDFDKAWKRIYEDVVSYVAVGSRAPVNTGMGVPSRLVGPDETGEKNSRQRTPIADFGLDPERKKRHSKHKYSTPIWRK